MHNSAPIEQNSDLRDLHAVMSSGLPHGTALFMAVQSVASRGELPRSSFIALG